MKIVLAIFLYLNLAHASGLKVEPSTKSPVLTETFTVDFILDTEEEGEPLINFEPLGVEVVDRSEVKTMTKFTYINGERSLERSLTVTYELQPTKPGLIYLRNIEAEINGKKYKHETIKFSVVKTPQKTSKIFLKAELDKEKLYVGESLVVRYYLYSRNDVPITSYDIVKFPKLSSFLKRFHQEQMSPERVRVDGKIYVRRIIYTAQLFTEKAGKFTVDPMKMKVSYSKRSNNPFGGFGFNLHLQKPSSTTVISSPVEINSENLPAEGFENHFSGLVGKHKFSLKMNKDKFITNEPIELELQIEGEGALELFEPPTLFNHQGIEEFEKSADLTLNKNFEGTKSVSYTYLSREPVSLDEKRIPISYFDPVDNKYVTEYLEIAPITVAGVGTMRRGEQNDSSSSGVTDRGQKTIVGEAEKDIYIFKPVLKALNTFMYTTKELFIISMMALIIILVLFIVRFIRNSKGRVLSDFDTIFRYGVNYAIFHKVLSKTEIEGDMEDIVKALELSKPALDYFLELIEKLNKDFSNEGGTDKAKLNKKYFKELEEKINELNEKSERSEELFST